MSLTYDCSSLKFIYLVLHLPWYKVKTKSVIDIVCREISQASPSEQVLLPETIFNAIFLLEKNILYSEQRVYKQCGCFCKATLTVCMSTLSILSQLGCLNIRSRQWTSRGKYPIRYRMWGHISGWIPDIRLDTGYLAGARPDTGYLVRPDTEYKTGRISEVCRKDLYR